MKPVLAALALAAACTAHAQYKVVGPDGRVTYTDRAPTGASSVVALPGDAATGGGVALPLALREATSRFPVTLYTAPDCPPCGEARELLRKRGVPHRERAASAGDRDAWLAAVGGPEVPALAVGRQMLRGLSPSQWNAWLDTAGYPQQSQLPPNYVHPPAQPLVEPARAAAPPPPAPKPIELPPPPQPGAIRF